MTKLRKTISNNRGNKKRNRGSLLNDAKWNGRRSRTGLHAGIAHMTAFATNADYDLSEIRLALAAMKGKSTNDLIEKYAKY